METDDGAARQWQRELGRRGYDAISLADRSDDGEAASSSGEDVGRYAGWVAELADLSWRSSAHAGGPGPNATSVQRCSGTTQTPEPTFAGSKQHGCPAIWHRYIPEGDTGHSLILSRAS